RRLMIITAACGAAVSVSGIAIGKRPSRAAVPRNGLIAFMRPGTIGEYDLWAVRADGTGLRRLTQAPANRSDYNPTWSPTGSVVLFERRKTADVPGSDEALYEVRPNGGRVR